MGPERPLRESQSSVGPQFHHSQSPKSSKRQSMKSSHHGSASISGRASVSPFQTEHAFDTGSIGSSQSSFMEEIKHEIMVNYLYQRQCSHLWVSDGNGEREGILLRKSRGQYLACPPNLVDSTLAEACREMNLPVRVLAIPINRADLV